MASDKTAMVTGAASGIGKTIAQRLIDEGVAVIAVDIDGDGLDSAFEPSQVTKVVADLGNLDQRSSVIDAGVGVDYLVNAAGAILLKDIHDVTVEDWRLIQTVNAEATFFLCQGIGKTMPSGGSIVNLSSSSAKLATTVEAAVYAASKTTILSITRSFAYALAGGPVRVNAICPAIIDTPMQEKVLAEAAALRSMSVDELRKARNANVPMGRGGRPEEVAALAWFLLGDEGSYMTGQAINIGGGYVTW
jgi:NAD(P)-dependent dehydrogenase (short-subunit alcohol dehydrogenase family)